MPDHQAIYQHQPMRYEQLIACEDYQGNLPRALHAMLPESQHTLSVVELGAGTGRLTRIIAPRVAHIWALDRAWPMLNEARLHLLPGKSRHWCLVQARHRYLPLPTGLADVVLAGWSVCYLVVGQAQWRALLEAGLQEMTRVLCPGGLVILIETLGTGVPYPAPLAGLSLLLDLPGGGWLSTALGAHGLPV